VIVDPEDYAGRKVPLDVRLSRLSQCLRWASKLECIGVGVGYTNKSKPGQQFAFVDATGQPKYVKEYHPLITLDAASPKRWAEYDYSDAVELATLSKCFESIWRAVKGNVPLDCEINRENLSALLAQLPLHVRKNVAWVEHLVEPTSSPLHVTGAGRAQSLANHETVVNTMVANIENVTIYNGACLDTIAACPSALLKLALIQTHEDLATMERVESYRETLIHHGVPVDFPGVFVIEERPIEKHPGLMVPKYRVTVTWPRLDAGKVKFLSPFKGTLNIIPIQFWYTDEKGNQQPVDVVFPKDTAVKAGKEALGAVGSGMAAEAGIKSIKDTTATAEQYVTHIRAKLVAKGLDQDCVRDVTWANLYEEGIYTPGDTRNIGRCLNPDVDRHELGRAVVVPMPCYRPSQTVEITSNVDAQVKVELHAALFAGIWPDVSSREFSEVSAELEEIGMGLAAVMTQLKALD
jgi:hypothetical protein